MDLKTFYHGDIFDAYEWMGAHVGPGGVTFRTYAPRAKWVNLLLNGSEVVMQKALDGNFYEITVPYAKEGDHYEYRIYREPDDVPTDHCDPYGFGMELRPGHRSIVRNRFSYTFHDEAWMKTRSDCKDRALNIYELHLGSWRKPGKGKEDWYTYEELAPLLVDYLNENGYNYVEFMPISEHPCDNSWGYQNTGFFAPTSRYGTMDQLKFLIDHLHQNNIGVILDYVPVHFAVDEYGLGKYDGTPLYEYPHPDVAVSEWGSYNFLHAKGEVRSFLQSCAHYWLKEFHFDGLRMDAISRIIYWHGDVKRGENKEAIEFIRYMNKGLKWMDKGIMLIAEDSTDYPNVTKPSDQGGLGFDYKWDMGWMHDTLEFFQLDCCHRKPNYHKLTFSMMYFWNEHYLLPLSHDEVVHGKATILQKMNGFYEDKFPQAKTMYLYMMMHPGKKLIFMGNEFGQLREWDEEREQDWDMLRYPNHDSFHEYMRELCGLYQNNPAFYELDYETAGFEWLDCHEEQRLIYAMGRRSKEQNLLAIFNMDCVPQEYSLTLGKEADAKCLLNSDWYRFGGETPDDAMVLSVYGKQLNVRLPKYGCLLIELKEKKQEPFVPKASARVLPKAADQSSEAKKPRAAGKKSKKSLKSER